MKKQFKKTVFSLTMILSLLGCSSDSDSSISTPAPCPPGYTGTNCNIPITPTKIKITKFKVANFPNVDDSGVAWDFGSSGSASNPDIYLQLGSYITEIYYNDVLSNGTNSFEFTPNAPVEITNVNNIHSIYLGDWDSPPTNPHDLMAQIDFYPYQSINGFPSTLTLIENSTSSSFKVELTLNYEW